MRGLSYAEDGGRPGGSVRKLPPSMRLDLSRARTDSSEGAAPGGLSEDNVWGDRDAADITLATLHLLSHWLLQAPPSCRQAGRNTCPTLQLYLIV